MYFFNSELNIFFIERGYFFNQYNCRNENYFLLDLNKKLIIQIYFFIIKIYKLNYYYF